jgi:hypothetical protein
MFDEFAILAENVYFSPSKPPGSLEAPVIHAEEERRRERF